MLVSFSSSTLDIVVVVWQFHVFFFSIAFSFFLFLRVLIKLESVCACVHEFGRSPDTGFFKRECVVRRRQHENISDSARVVKFGVVSVCVWRSIIMVGVSMACYLSTLLLFLDKYRVYGVYMCVYSQLLLLLSFRRFCDRRRCRSRCRRAYS